MPIVPLSQKSEEEREKWRPFSQSDLMFMPENLAEVPLKGALFDQNMD